MTRKIFGRIGTAMLFLLLTASNGVSEENQEAVGEGLCEHGYSYSYTWECEGYLYACCFTEDGDSCELVDVWNSCFEDLIDFLREPIA